MDLRSTKSGRRGRPGPRGRGRIAGAMALAIGLALLAGVPARASGAELDWQAIGQARGVEAFSARGADGSVRIRFRNSNRHAVSITVARTLIWCGSRRKGAGVPVEARIEPFVLRPGQDRTRAAWVTQCGLPDYYVEFRGIAIEPIT